jgi:hypothetical protein
MGYNKRRKSEEGLSREGSTWFSSCFNEVTECDQTESEKSRHYALLESDKTLFGMR